MPYSNNIVSKPIDIGRDLAAIWGFSRYDLGYIISNAHSNNLINMWSKHKPVPWNGDVNPQGTHPSSWWLGVNGDYGIKSKTIQNTQHNVATLINYIDGQLNGWSYEIDTRAYRALDFDDYYSAAANPFGTLNVSIKYPSIAPGDENSIRIDGDIASYNARSIALSDLKAVLYQGEAGGSPPSRYDDFENLYVGVCFYKQVSNGWQYNGCYITQEPLSNLNTPTLYSIGTSQSQIGNYRAYPALFDGYGIVQDDYSINPSTGCYYNPAEPTCYSIVTFPFMSYASFSVANAVAPAITMAEFHINNDIDDTVLYDSGTWSFTMKASNNYYTTFIGMKVQVEINGTIIGTIFDASTTGTTYGVSANGTQTINGTYKPSDFGYTPDNFYGGGRTTRIKVTGSASINGNSSTLTPVYAWLYKVNH